MGRLKKWIFFRLSLRVLRPLLTVAGVVYMLLALWGTRDFVRSLKMQKQEPGMLPPVTVLKPLKGVDVRMYAGLASHCRQAYGGGFELIFGVSTPDDPAVAEVDRLRAEFPGVEMQLVVCPQRLGTSGKVSNLVQMLEHARYEHVLINDSDILVSPRYLAGVMRYFGEPRVGMVTAPYVGRTAREGCRADGVGEDRGAGYLDRLHGGRADGAQAGGRDSVWVGVYAGDEPHRTHDCRRNGTAG